MSVRTTPESPPPEEKFPHGMVRVIPLESFGDGAREPKKKIWIIVDQYVFMQSCLSSFIQLKA